MFDSSSTTRTRGPASAMTGNPRRFSCEFAGSCLSGRSEETAGPGRRSEVLLVGGEGRAGGVAEVLVDMKHGHVALVVLGPHAAKAERARLRERLHLHGTSDAAAAMACDRPRETSPDGPPRGRETK